MANKKNTRSEAGNGKKTADVRNGAGKSAFMRFVEDKRIMVSVTVFLSVCVVALTLLIALESTGILYGYIPKKNEKPADSVVDGNDRELVDAAPVVSGNYEYRLYTDGTAELHFYKDNYAEEIVIPSEIDGHKVTAIGDECFVWLAYLTSVTVPDGVTYIGVEAFSGCGNLAVLKLPSTLTRVADDAFKDCPSDMTVEYSGDLSKVKIGYGNEALLSSIEG